MLSVAATYSQQLTTWLNKYIVSTGYARFARLFRKKFSNEYVRPVYSARSWKSLFAAKQTNQSCDCLRHGYTHFQLAVSSPWPVTWCPFVSSTSWPWQPDTSPEEPIHDPSSLRNETLQSLIGSPFQPYPYLFFWRKLLALQSFHDDAKNDPLLHLNPF